jgi:hypothetical protein
MPQPLYAQGVNPWYPLNRKLDGSQSQFRCFGEERNPLSLLEVKLQSLRHPANGLVTTLTKQQGIFFFQKSITTEVSNAVMLHLHINKHTSTISAVVGQHV